MRRRGETKRGEGGEEKKAEDDEEGISFGEGGLSEEDMKRCGQRKEVGKKKDVVVVVVDAKEEGRRKEEEAHTQVQRLLTPPLEKNVIDICR